MVPRAFLSLLIPSMCILNKGIVQRGHGHKPLFLMQDIKTLMFLVRGRKLNHRLCLLFGVISRVNENSRVEPAQQIIATFGDNAMCVGGQELVVKNHLQLGMSKLSVTMRHELRFQFFIACIQHDKIFE